jgi:DNA-binding NarL/FixJ family response regulator
MIRVLIADDHPLIREGLKHVVASSHDIQVVSEAETATATLEACARGGVDVVLLDITMPGPGFIEVIQRLRTTAPSIRILMLSVHPEEHFARRAIQAGAHGYLTKDHSTEELASAIRRVFSGKKYITASLAEELALDLMGEPRDRHEGLTNREYEVFLELGAGETVDQISRKLKLSPKSVRTYRSRIVEKLGLASTSKLIVYAVRRGLVPGLTASSASGPHLYATPPFIDAPRGEYSRGRRRIAIRHR